MKAIRFFSHHLSLVALTAFLLSVTSLQAQTVSGVQKQSTSPSHLEATVYPLSASPATIKVIFNNYTGGAVRIVIRDEKGKVYYDEYDGTPKYRRRFDLSLLPEGNYSVDLSKVNEHFTQTFAIYPPERSRIALDNVPVQTNPDKTGTTKLVADKQD